MARVCTYLTFDGDAEQALDLYRTVFGTEFETPLARYKDMPGAENAPPAVAAAGEKVLHAALPILGGHVLMASDAVGGCGRPLVKGNNAQIMLAPDSRAEADRLFAALSAGGETIMPMQEMFWGGYFGSFTDRFGVNWMINCESKE